jgi:gliding motility associated protien GldN
MITTYLWGDNMKIATTGVIDGDEFLYPILNDSYYQANILSVLSVVDSTGLDSIYCTDPTDPSSCDVVMDPVTGKKLLTKDLGIIAASTQKYTTEDIVAWDIKEDWFFDKQRSVMDVRIIGIAPVVYMHEKLSDLKSPVVGTRALCWFYFPQIRPIIQNYFVFNRKNDAQRMSFDDLFWKRTFSSYVTKESSIFDRKINDYTSGIDALLESEKIKKEMMELEHDVWEF